MYIEENLFEHASKKNMSQSNDSSIKQACPQDFNYPETAVYTLALNGKSIKQQMMKYMLI